MATIANGGSFTLNGNKSISVATKKSGYTVIVHVSDDQPEEWQASGSADFSTPWGTASINIWAHDFGFVDYDIYLPKAAGSARSVSITSSEMSDGNTLHTCTYDRAYGNWYLYTYVDQLASYIGEVGAEVTVYIN